MNRLKLQQMIKEELDNLTEGGRVRSRYLSPKEVIKLMASRNAVYGTDYFGDKVQIITLSEIKSFSSLRAFKKFDGGRWLETDESYFEDWLDENGMEVGDWLVATTNLKNGKTMVSALSGWNFQDGGVTVKNTDNLTEGSRTVSHPLKENYDRLFNRVDRRLVESGLHRNGRTIYEYVFPGSNWRDAVAEAKSINWSRQESFTGNITGKIKFIQRVNGVDVLHDVDHEVFIFVKAEGI